MLTDNTRKYLLGFNGSMTKSNTCLFTTVQCLIPENVYGRPLKKTGNGLAADCQLFYRKIYGYFCSEWFTLGLFSRYNKSVNILPEKHTGMHFCGQNWVTTVQILCIGTDRSQQTVQTKIRLLLQKQSDQGLRCLPFHQHLLDALMQCYYFL